MLDPTRNGARELDEAPDCRRQQWHIEREREQGAARVQNVGVWEHGQVRAAQPQLKVIVRYGSEMQSQPVVTSGGGGEPAGGADVVTATGDEKARIVVIELGERLHQSVDALVGAYPPDEGGDALFGSQPECGAGLLPTDRICIGASVMAVRHDDVRNASKPRMGLEHRFDAGFRQRYPSIDETVHRGPEAALRVRASLLMRPEVVGRPDHSRTTCAHSAKSGQKLHRAHRRMRGPGDVDRDLGPMDVHDVDVAASTNPWRPLLYSDSELLQRRCQQGVVAIAAGDLGGGERR